MRKKIDYSLYLVTDRSFLSGRGLEDVVAQALDGGVTVVQIREKEADSRQFYELARKLKGFLDRRSAALIVNDRLDIALAVGADGVHLGQEDMPYPEARRLMGAEAVIGLSVETVAQAREAEEWGADYLGIGPVFPTATKLDAGEALGPDRVKQICAATKLPSVAIGGISMANVASLKGCGLAGIAVVSAIMGASSPKAAAMELRGSFK